MITKCANCDIEINRRPCRMKKNNYCSNKCQMVFEYANGIRDKFEITKKAHAAIRKFGHPKLKGRKPWNKGLTKLSHPSVAQQAKSVTGKGNPMYGKRGKDHHLYKNGKYTSDKKRYWNTSEYQNWRKFIFNRDDFTCQECGDNKGGNLEAHHIKPIATFPNLIFTTSNGITLCKKCHLLHHRNNTASALTV